MLSSRCVAAAALAFVILAGTLASGAGPELQVGSPAVVLVMVLA